MVGGGGGGRGGIALRYSIWVTISCISFLCKEAKRGRGREWGRMDREAKRDTETETDR